jgi:hypothetical protein
MPFHFPLHHVYGVASYLLPLLKAQLIYYAQVQHQTTSLCFPGKWYFTIYMVKKLLLLTLLFFHSIIVVSLY